MREIKFRFYNKKTRKLLEECDMWWNYIEFLNENEVIVCQYTGLKDKNGKEIYEGDVVEFSGYKKDRVEIVKWENIGNHTAFGGGTHNAKVIGNIYENN